MTLRRFPWKIPRMTDNSYKLFASDPTPGHDPKKLIHPPNKSTSDLAQTPERDVVPASSDEQKHAAKPESDKAPAKSTETTNPVPYPVAVPGGGEKREVIKGPWRILRLLPRETRHVVGRMLEINPKKRAKMSEILDDFWVSNTVICRQTESGQVINATDHTHVLEPPNLTAK